MGTARTQQDRARFRRDMIYHMVAAAAERGERCPSNAELASAVGYSCRASAWPVLERLQDEGRIHMERCRSDRRISIPGTPHQTFCEGDWLPPVGRCRVREVVDHAALIFDVTTKDILSPSRFKEHRNARQAVCLVAFEQGWAIAHIGRIVGRDHSTVRHAIEMIAERAKRDPEVARQVHQLRERSKVELPRRLAA